MRQLPRLSPARPVLVGLLLLFALTTFAQKTYLYVSDGGKFDEPPWQILRAEADGSSVGVFTKEELAWPQDLVFLEDQGIVLISNLNSGKINKHDANTGAYLGEFAGGIGGPTRMKIGPDTLLYVLQWRGNGKVLRYDLEGQLVDEFTERGVTNSIGMDWDAGGDLYVSSWTGQTVRRFGPDGADKGLFISSGLQGPTNLHFREDGDLLVLNWQGNSVKRFDPSGADKGDFITGLGRAEGIAVRADGNYLIGNGATHSVRMFDSTGVFLEELIPRKTLELLLPNALVLRPVGTTATRRPADRRRPFLRPSVGSEFYWADPTLPPPVSLEFIAIDGRQAPYRLAGTGTGGRWSAAGLPNGMYVVRITLAGGKVLTQRVTVQR